MRRQEGKRSNLGETLGERGVVIAKRGFLGCRGCCHEKTSPSAHNAF